VKAGVIGDIESLVAIPAPTFSEEPRLRWLESRLANAPGRRARLPGGTLVWSWGEGAPDLVLMAHVDTVFSEGTELRVRRDGDALVGPGVGDNAAAVAVAVAVVEQLLAEPTIAPGAVAFTVGEEGLGNLRGAWEVCERLTPAAVIALEGHGLEKVIVDAVGSIRARLTITGPGGHSWVDRGTPSAIAALLGCAGRLLELSEPAAPINVGTIAGGRSVNAIADYAECVVERRALNESSLDEFADKLRSLEVPYGLSLKTEIVGRRPAGRLDRNAPLLGSVRAIRARLGLPDTLGDGSTDANAALASGVPAVCLGVAEGSGMHTLAERIDLRSLELGERQLRDLLSDLLCHR
jgi:acetylornithine deacetylase/succinyl-diaminopimelate desuccinylase-like protein